jgi:FdrA protein
VLGYGSNADPAAEMIPAMRRARDIAAAEGRHIVFVGHVCGTDADPQSLNRQVHLLTDAGMILTESNAQAVRLAASLVVSREPQRKQ